eukprot:gene11615-21853_t
MLNVCYYLLAFGSLVRVSSCQLSSSGKANKELLAKLRKETGFPFSKCQTALVTCSNDFAKAFAWLEEQSKKEGWKKAEKVKGRQTSHGLIGAVVRDNIAAMVEVNCETDFVSRNEVFRNLTMDIVKGALYFKQRVLQQNALINSLAGEDNAHLREIIPPHELDQVQIENGLLKDSIVSVISQLGENIVINRAVTISTSKTNLIGIYAHGNNSGHIDGVHFGKYLGLVVLHNNGDPKITSLATGLAQHVVGMRPQYIDKEVNDNEAELVLLNQEYLLDGDITVRNLLEKFNTRVIDFLRYQCGE